MNTIKTVGDAGNAGAAQSVEAGEMRAEIGRLVAELRERTAALEAANRELRRVSRYRSLFLARMSHELRTPLTSIIGFAEILTEHCGLDGTQREFCEKILASGQRLRGTVNQLLDLSRLEAGQAELFLHEFSVRETLRDSCEAVARLAENRRVVLDCETAPDCGPVVSDEGKLRQVLYNLLAHAVARSPERGTVRVSARPCDEGERLRVEIADEGEPVAEPARLFEPAEDAPTCAPDGGMSELGLAIAHHLCGALGGTVVPVSNTPQGLKLRVEIPARPPAG